MKSIIDSRDLRSGYGEMEIIRGVDLTLAEGDIYAIIGKNGAGKTTLVKTFMGMLPVFGGTLKLLGEPVEAMNPSLIVALGVSCAPQEQAFFNDLTVEENLRLGALGLARTEIREGFDRIVAMFPFIGERFRQKAGTLSGGEQAMVKVGRALLPKPRLVLLDEVTEGLQPMIVDRVRDVLLRDHAERGTTFLIVEQNVEFVSGLASRFGLMARGRIQEEGNFDQSGARERITRHLLI